MMFALRPVSRWLDHVTDVLFAILLFSQLVKYCKADKPFNCAGGSIYFVAHPVDTLLYQSPDIYHDFYVYKCVTTVVFTTGDRGLDGNFTNSLERGLQAAYAFMAGVEEKEATWDEDKVEVGDKKVLLRSLNKAPNVQVIYLRLPGGKPDGQGFDSNHGETLKKLYQGSFMTVTTTDEATTYTLEQLRAVISGILKQRKAVDIRIMDKTAAIAKDNQKECEHADHSTSARIVSDVIAQDEIEGKVLSYAAALVRRLGPTLNGTSQDFKAKVDAFNKYAPFDKDMPKDYETALADVESASGPFPDDDVQYIVNWMDREYYTE